MRASKKQEEKSADSLRIIIRLLFKCDEVHYPAACFLESQDKLSDTILSELIIKLIPVHSWCIRSTIARILGYQMELPLYVLTMLGQLLYVEFQENDLIYRSIRSLSLL